MMSDTIVSLTLSQKDERKSDKTPSCLKKKKKKKNPPSVTG